MPEESISLPVGLALSLLIALAGLLPCQALETSESPATAGAPVKIDSSGDVPLTKLEPKLAPPRPQATAVTAVPTPLTTPRADSQEKQTSSAAGPSTAASGSSADVQASAAASKGQNANVDNYPTIGKMEVLTFGNAKPELRVDQRLSALEEAVFKKVNSEQTLFDRTQRLKATILGNPDEPLESTEISELGSSSLLDTISRGLRVGEPEKGQVSYLDEVAQLPENQKEVDSSELQRIALELVNYARVQSGVSPLVGDELAHVMARDHADDLAGRNLLSHASASGANPDLRYTALGGSDAITESLVSLNKGQLKMPCFSRALVAQILKAMLDRQDDREAILSGDATGLGFSTQWMAGKTRVVACTEISTKHGIMQPISMPIAVGEKVDVKGLVHEPYKFDRITLAWEGGGGTLPSAGDEAEEALPYFPPLDYVAYASKAEHDYEKAIATLRTLGVIAAIAGGVFMPPVVLAAPLIATAGGMSEPKPASDIPVHGGVKIEGLTFTGKIPFSNGGKDGIYYVTVWASNRVGGKSIPISRRAFALGAGGANSDKGAYRGKHNKRKAKIEEGAELKQ
jgi:uncharacterized protein YkwD